MTETLIVLLAILLFLYLKRLVQSRRIKKWPSDAEKDCLYMCIQPWEEISCFFDLINPKESIESEYFAVMKVNDGTNSRYEIFKTSSLLEKGKEYDEFDGK